MTRTLRVGVDSVPTNFDQEQPVAFANRVGADIYRSLYDQLTAPTPVVDAAGRLTIDWANLRPDLAEAWWFSDDRRTCTFRIRRGVWSDLGHELTAEAVKWGWERAFGLRDIGKWVARISSIQEPDDIEVVDRYTLAFHLATTNPMLPRTMAQATPSVYDIEALQTAITADDPWAKRFLAENPAGFGPYRLAHAGDHLVLEAHRQYWRGRPAIDEVRVDGFESLHDAAQALEAGGLDLVAGISKADALRLSRSPRHQIVTVAGAAGLLLYLDETEPPFGDPLVRQAVACAVPYRRIIQTAFLGDARRWRSYLQPQALGYADDLWPYDEDVARARDLLAQSSMPDGFSTRLVVIPGDNLDVAAEVLRAGLRRIGVDVEIESLAGKQRLAGLQKANLGPMMLKGAEPTGRGNRVFDPVYALTHDFGPGRMRLTRFTHDDDAIYALIQRISEAADPADWLAAVREAQQVVNTAATAIPICSYPVFAAMDSRLDGYRWYPDNTLAFADLRWAA